MVILETTAMLRGFRRSQKALISATWLRIDSQIDSFNACCYKLSLPLTFTTSVKEIKKQFSSRHAFLLCLRLKSWT